MQPVSEKDNTTTIVCWLLALCFHITTNLCACIFPCFSVPIHSFTYKEVFIEHEYVEWLQPKCQQDTVIYQMSHFLVTFSWINT